MSNLGDLKNPNLKHNVISGTISTSKIASMTTEVCHVSVIIAIIIIIIVKMMMIVLIYYFLLTLYFFIVVLNIWYFYLSVAVETSFYILQTFRSKILCQWTTRLILELYIIIRMAHSPLKKIFGSKYLEHINEASTAAES